MPVGNKPLFPMLIGWNAPPILNPGVQVIAAKR